MILVDYRACGHAMEIATGSRDEREEIERASSGQPCPRCRAQLDKPLPPPRNQRSKGWQGPGPGRTPNAEKGLPNQDRIISFRGTEGERQRLSDQAEAAGQTLAQYIRDRCGL